MDPLLERVDHLVFATSDLESTVADVERRLGVRPAPGGRHLDRGTRNALLALGPRCYLEILGPDPEQEAPPAPRWFGIDALPSPRLVAWAANTADLEQVTAGGARSGVGFGPIASGHRTRADGVTLRWRFTDPTTLLDDGLIPFFIEWGSSPHPASSAPAGGELVALVAEHPDPRRVRDNLVALGLDLDVTRGPRPALIATIRTATSTVEIR
ncbi:MAG TPA: VOC family protein [Candidatus Binatia bacterium]|nr:VOC family protein [Candidatus Binatia bacterium]